MLSKELVGRRVKATAGSDHAPLIAAHRRPTPLGDGPEGAVTRINDLTGRVSGRIEEPNRASILPLSDAASSPHLL
jgi:hypothetical protein